MNIDIGYDGEHLWRLVGRTITQIDGMVPHSEHVEFTFDDGSKLFMYHSEVCCETVDIEDVIGDPEDLIGSPLTLFEVAQGNLPARREMSTLDADSYTWTFVRIATAQGHVDVRWYGESNGWYSEVPAFHYRGAA